MRGCIPISERIVRWKTPICYLDYTYDIRQDGHVWRKRYDRKEWEKTNLRCRWKRAK